MEALESAQISIDIAMYSFTDRPLAEQLVRLAQNVVRVHESIVTGENTRKRDSGSSTTEILI